ARGAAGGRRRGGSGGGRFGGGLGCGAAQALEGEHRAGGDGGADDQREQEHQRVADQRGHPEAAVRGAQRGAERGGQRAGGGRGRGRGGRPRGGSSAKRGVSGRPPAARSAALSPISGANLAPCPEQGEQTTTGPERSSTNSSSAVEVYRQVASLKGSGSSPGSQRRT